MEVRKQFSENALLFLTLKVNKKYLECLEMVGASNFYLHGKGQVGTPFCFVLQEPETFWTMLNTTQLFMTQLFLEGRGSFQNESL